jgi:carboxyl-terminal processing protease
MTLFRLLVLALGFALLAAPEGRAAEGVNEEAIGRVFARAFAFMAPRLLTPVPLERLSFWALSGLSRLDPKLAFTSDADGLAVRREGTVLALASRPHGENAAAWGRIVGLFAATAASASPSLASHGTEDLVTLLFDAMLAHLDPYSRYRPPGTPEESAPERPESGILAAIDEGRAVVVAIRTESPAAQAAVPVGAEILAINGERPPAAAGALAERLSGEKPGERRRLLLSSGGRRREVVLTLAPAVPPSVFAELDKGVLSIRITAFRDETEEELRALLVPPFWGNAPLRGVILDLRGNRGGVLQQAIEASGLFLGNGLVAVTVGRAPEATEAWEVDEEAALDTPPLIALVDGGTASAAEVMAAALADDRRGVVVGSMTLGKGLVQTETPLPNGGRLYLTWSQIFAPLGWPLQDLGLFPQVCTSLGALPLSQALDALMRGEQPLSRALALHRTVRPPVSPKVIADLRRACPTATGTERDLLAAHYLIEHPEAYTEALLPAQFFSPAPALPAAGNTATPPPP